MLMRRSPQFDLVSQEFKHDPLPTLEHMRAEGAFVRVRLPIVGKLWLAPRYESANAVLRDQTLFALEPKNAGRKKMAGLRWWMPRTLRVLAKNMLTTDEPDHRRLRGLVEQAFLRQSVEELRPRIASLVEQSLDDFAEQAKAQRGEADLVKHVARPFPLAVICELLGLPDADRPRFSRWAQSLMDGYSVVGMARALYGMRHMLSYLKDQFESCRRNPRPGLISALVEAEQDGSRLSEDELLAMAFLLLFAGHETTVHLISGGVLTLLENDAQRGRLLADWSLVDRAVDECLRYFSPVQMTKPRYVRNDCEIFGHSFNQGEPVLAFLAAANHDPSAFDKPDEFQIERTPNPHLGFGAGIHICLGLKLAKAEVATTFRQLWERFPDVRLAQPRAELTWNKRLGIRAIKTLMLKVN